MATGPQSHLSIPILKDMGVEVRQTSGEQVVLVAPLKQNRNHQGTAFGGSIYSLAVMSCWALLNEKVQSLGFQVESLVIQDGQIRYLKPVESQFSATAVWPSEELQKQLHRGLKRKPTARIELKSVISTEVRNGSYARESDRTSLQTCCEFTGRFVVTVQAIQTSI